MLLHEIKLLAAALVITGGLYGLTEVSVQAYEGFHSYKGESLSLKESRSFSKKPVRTASSSTR